LNISINNLYANGAFYICVSVGQSFLPTHFVRSLCKCSSP
jgi:hypothetical protein